MAIEKELERRDDVPRDALDAQILAFSLPVAVIPLTDLKRWKGETWRRGDSKRFVLLNELDVASLTASAELTGVSAQPGFVTDFASIPFPVSAVMKPIGRYAQAALLHDWGYYKRREYGWKKSQWDELFYRGMLLLEVPSTRAWLMWKAVSWFGWLAWRAAPDRPDKEYEVGELVEALFGADRSGLGSTGGEPPDYGPVAAV